MIVIQSPRLQLSQFQMMDAQEVFGCITPAIARFMPWEPPSWSEYVERVRDAMREESAGSGTEQLFFRHPAARQQGMPWHGLIGRCGFCFARTWPLAQGKRARTGFWPGSRGRTCRVGTRNSRQGKFHLSGGHTKHRQQAYR